MRPERWLSEYLEQYRAAIVEPTAMHQVLELKAMLAATQAAGHKVIVAGNGGSAAISSHCAVDLSKSAGIRCINFNEADLITCLANDYGYEQWVQKALELYADDDDLAILISSSGRSPNMVNAGRYAQARGLALVTFTGFRPDNPLRQLGRLSFWVNSGCYNVVEMTHHIWLLAACDLIVQESTAAVKAAASSAKPARAGARR